MYDPIEAVIDADFFIKATQYEQGTTLFLRIMHDLGLHPVMHQFVADTELKKYPYLPALLNNCQLTVIHYENYLFNDQDRKDYENFFHEAYEKLNHFSFPENEDIYVYAAPHESLGEIRSLYMAVKNHYPYFMSDDGGSRLLAKTFLSNKHTTDVLCLYDALFQCKKQGTSLTWKDINPTVMNAMRSRQDRIETLKNLYRT